METVKRSVVAMGLGNKQVAHRGLLGQCKLLRITLQWLVHVILRLSKATARTTPRVNLSVNYGL